MTTSSKSILIIQEDLATRRTLEVLFRHCGWTVATASTVMQGLKLLQREPRYVILDLVLPDGHGELIIRTVKIMNPSVHIIVTTGCNDPSRLTTVDQLAPHALLHKPLDFSKIFSAIAESELLASTASTKPLSADARPAYRSGITGSGISHGFAQN